MEKVSFVQILLYKDYILLPNSIDILIGGWEMVKISTWEREIFISKLINYFSLCGNSP